MARSRNPFYQANAGPYDAIGQGITNLGGLFMPPDPARAAQAEQAAWAARQSRENVTDITDARGGRQQMGDMLGQFDPQGDNRQLFAEGIGSGAMDPSNLGALFHAMQANFGGTDDQVGRSHVGMGNTIGVGDGFSRDDREGIRASDFGNQQALQGQQDAASMQRLQARLSNERSMAAAEGGGVGVGGEGLGDEFNPLDATRISSLESDAEEAVNNLADDLGLSPGALPPELRTWLLDSTVQALLSGDYASPRAAAGALWQQSVQGTRKEGGFLGMGGRQELDYAIPPQQSPRVDPTPASRGAPAEISSDAEYDALPSGAEFVGPDGVRRRKP